MQSAKITQLIEWDKNKRINFEPAYQRKGGIWSQRDKEELIVTIVKDLPLPELFLHHRSNGEDFVYDVVDGKQRLTAILDYVYRDKNFESRIDFAEKKNERKKFVDLLPEQREKILDYEVRFFEIKNLELPLLNEIFVRINRTGRKLTKQEIRNAVFKGDFINLAKELCEKGKSKNYFIKHKTITQDAQRRMGDVEFACELLAYIKDGVQEKKKTLDKIIGAGESLHGKNKMKKRFVRILCLISSILPNLKETRLSQKSDFYSLFGAICDLDNEGYNLENPEHQKLARLVLMDFSNAVDEYKINLGKHAKEKDVVTPDIEKYYNTIQQGTDTKAHRTVRIDYLKKLLSSLVAKKDTQRLFSPEQRRLLWNTDTNKECALCGKKIESWDDLEIDHKTPWSLGGTRELKNGQLAHGKWSDACNQKHNNKLKLIA